MSFTTKLIVGSVLFCCFKTGLAGQEVCSGEDPFTVSPARTFCVDSLGIAQVNFNILHVGGVGEYTVSFPDGSDTTYKEVTGTIAINREFFFDCAMPTGSPRIPTELDRYYEYRGGFSVVRNDCVDSDGDRPASNFIARIVPNPIREIEISNLTCRSAPYIVNVSAAQCSEELVKKYTWYFDDRLIPGADGPTLKDYVIAKPGDHKFRLDATTFSDQCETFSVERSITITAAPTLTLNYTLDSAELCSPSIEVITNTIAENINEFTWSSNSPDVTFSDFKIASPVIRINNETPGSRRIFLTATSADCGTVTKDFTIQTFSGQTITADPPLTTCTALPFDLCETISYSSPPKSVAWASTDPSVTLTGQNGRCPVATFATEGSYVLVASGIDICGFPFTLPVTVEVRNGDSLRIDSTGIGTICQSSPPFQLLDYIAPRGNVSSIIGRGVTATNFDPAGLSGEVALLVTDSCGVEYPLSIFVREEGVFSGGNPTICQGSTLDLARIQEGNYTGAGVADNIFNSSGLLPGPYTVAFSSTAFCGGNGNFTITVEAPRSAGFSITPTERCEQVDSFNLSNVFRTDTPLEIVNTSASGVRCYQVLERGDLICDLETTTLSFEVPGTYTLRQIVGPKDGVCRDTTDKVIESIAPLKISSAVAVDSSSCDSLGLLFTATGTAADLEYSWAFSNGDSSEQASPVLEIIRPLSADVFRATLQVSDACYLQRDTLYVDLPRRFQVAFGILNDNNTVCSGETVYLVDNSVNATGLVVTLPDGTILDRLPDSIVITNTTQEVLVYPIRLAGTSAGCPNQVALDTIFVLPVATEAAFQLEYEDDCTPAVVNLTNLASPGARSVVSWGDGGTDQPIEGGETLRYAYRTDRDTTFAITMVSKLCGIDTFRRTFMVRAGADAGFTVSSPDASCAGVPLEFVPDNVLPGGSAKWLFGDGDSSLMNQPIHVYATRGTYRVSLEVTNTNGCTATSADTVAINDYSGPSLQASIPTTICVDAPFVVGDNGSATGLSYDYGNQLRASAAIERPYREEGIFPFTLTATDGNGCQIDTTVVVEVFPRFTVQIQPDEKDITVEFGDALQLSFRMDPLRLIDSVSWVGDSLDSPNTQRTVAYPLNDGLYRLHVLDEYGCLATDSLRVNVGRNYERLIYVPNAFSPNGDGTNETFGVDAKPNTVRSLRALRVFSRWGETIYACTDCPLGNIDHGWDGERGGKPLSSGVYVWTADIEFRDGHREVFRGTVAIVK